jgi:hypothetical protein
MRKTIPGLGAVVVVLSLPVVFALSASGAPIVVADWQMNEPAGTTVMHDSVGDHDGAVDPTGVTANGSFYHWDRRCPACPPTAPERVVTVADSAELDIPDAGVPYVLEFRYRTRSAFGNIMQKGQSGTTGGQIKVQLPKGKVQCLFKGANGVRVGAGSGSNVYNDGRWHTVKCVHTNARVETWVDGVRVGVKNGSTGPIDNAKVFAIGGKTNCDQVKVTCDYYSGDIDWVRVTRGE